MDALRNASPWSQCIGKERFASGALAARVAHRRTASKKHRGKPSRPLTSYRCQHCGFFHIGGQS